MNNSHRRALIVILMLVLVGLALALPAYAQDGGNSGAAHLCQQGGWRTLTRTDGTTFRNQGDCVSHAAQGGSLVSLNESYREGLSVFEEGASRVAPLVNDLDLVATKYVDGANRSTEIVIHAIYYAGPGDGSDNPCCIYGFIDTTVMLPGDANQLEVSNDLGTGQLDGTIWVEQTLQLCLYGGECRLIGTSTVPVEMHLTVITDSQVQFDGTYYSRDQIWDIFGELTNVSGSVNINGKAAFTFPFPRGNFHDGSGSVFSTRAPFPN